ncbi:glycine zipper family protein [Janthinobacterium sp. SUN073]|uniref:glycine zipper family protein n=1 Tax=Janthinobacterium sp. SUN073 TaxID=3004102 RepID=UPI0025B25D49|nr:glycine zipper family protein [Janthinobacterium sp. SUN073]MDN2698117.1 glycine zipper family protein [Janthinobacterium sp. SUN073]
MNTRALMGRAGLLAPLLLTACTVLPEGPSAMVLPGTGKSLEQFRGDDGSCRGYAQAQLAGTGAADSSSYGMQRRYDNAYQQCMYASGHKVPVAGQMLSGVPANAATPPPDTPPPRY